MIRAALIWLMLALPVAAQELPDWQHTSINDFAGVLTADDTRVLDQALIKLFEETDIEGTVVTLPDRTRYGGSDGLEAFATRLFNHWGVGDAERNDGFMVLVLVKDREARIELGAGYPREADILAQDVMRNVMLPEFREGRMSEGIRKGTLAVIESIARPVAAGDELREPKGKGIPLVPGLIGFGMAGFILFQIIRKQIRGIGKIPSKCPKCGGTGLIEDQDPATPERPAQANETTFWIRCPNCDWKQNRPRSGRGRGFGRSGISVGGRSGGFGGGRSSGGGASGRW
ncbi:TPM domain-containing protein [Paracoccus caeni]|uniref:TPM domain-containing protein n=1 Tax=Paracoccus caeni TaxID=657651 RepID=A0A934SH85_9RHOB|nr:TPM domain-containing protein [Paracoccus caeni]MBK4217812.1 TPM domain-containing protein [Paracoccus caeni]